MEKTRAEEYIGGRIYRIWETIINGAGGGAEGPTTREVKLDSRFVTCSGELVLMIKQKKITNGVHLVWRTQGVPYLTYCF